MVTKTIYTDPYMVVIDVGAVPPTEEWLQETTYLIDKSGHTTAMIAQTDQPTNGVTPQPVPFTPLNAQISLAASPKTTSSLAPAAPPRSAGNSNTVIALTAIGAIFGMAVMAATLYLLRRRAARQRLRAQSSSLSSENSATIYSSDSSDSIENIFNEYKMAQGTDQVLPTWEDFLEEAKREYGQFDESENSSSEGFHPSSESTGGRQSTAGLRERYVRLIAHRSNTRPNAGPGPDTWGRLPAIEEPASTTRQTKKVGYFDRGILRAVAQPTSILKHSGASARKEMSLMDAVQRKLGVEDGKPKWEDVETKPAAFNNKKTVRFGIAEIREFGRTPLPSNAGSMFSWDHE